MEYMHLAVFVALASRTSAQLAFSQLHRISFAVGLLVAGHLLWSAPDEVLFLGCVAQDEVHEDQHKEFSGSRSPSSLR